MVKHGAVNRHGVQKLISGRLGLRPSLRSVQNSQDDYLFVANFIDSDERERREGDLSRALDTTRAPEVRKCFQCNDALNHGRATRLADSGRLSAM
jgi:hypothetical protein